MWKSAVKRKAMQNAMPRKATQHTFNTRHVEQSDSVRRVLRHRGAQAKLTIGQPNDKYEQEADHVSDQVMRMSNTDIAQRVEDGIIQPMQIQRMCTECEEEITQRQLEEGDEQLQAKFNDESIQRQEEDEEEEAIQAKESLGQTPQLNAGVESRINGLKSGGQPLDETTRGFFEQRFGRDFSSVRIHNTEQAADVSRSINARAFTLGNNIAFGSGEYQPESSKGKRLLGHELTHVLQQNGTTTAQTKIQRVPAGSGTITSETVAISPGARTRTTIGVGEEVTLTHSAGVALWTASGGTLSSTSGTSVTLTAPDTAQTVTVRAGGSGVATKDFTVIAPNNVNMDRESGTGIKHTANIPNIGIKTRPFLSPDTVNFYNAIIHEIDLPGVPTTPGVYSCNPFSTGHCGGPCGDAPATNTVVASKGTKINGVDTVYSGYCPAQAAPFTPGSLTLSIPWEYKIGAGSYHRFDTVTQYHALLADTNATLIASKAGASGMTWVNFPTSTY